MRRDPKTGAPDFFCFARDFLHAYLPKTRGLSPKTIEAYRISLECYLNYLTDTEHIERDRVSFDHFDRQHLKGWMTWMADQRPLRDQDRHVAPQRRQGVSGLRVLRRSHPRRAQPGRQGTQGPSSPQGAHRVPRRTRNTGDPCRIRRVNDEVPQKPDVAHLAL